jgi:hypothetical protein
MLAIIYSSIQKNYKKWSKLDRYWAHAYYVWYRRPLVFHMYFKVGGCFVAQFWS